MSKSPAYLIYVLYRVIKRRSNKTIRNIYQLLRIQQILKCKTLWNGKSITTRTLCIVNKNLFPSDIDVHLMFQKQTHSIFLETVVYPMVPLRPITVLLPVAFPDYLTFPQTTWFKSSVKDLLFQRQREEMRGVLFVNKDCWLSSAVMRTEMVSVDHRYPTSFSLK